MLVRSGYNANDMGAYMELRDDRVCFFVRALCRAASTASATACGPRSRASSAPCRRAASAMYAPELKGNSDEIKIKVVD